VLLLAFRDGRNLGTRPFFPRTNGEESPEEVLAAFVSQYYIEFEPPREILLDREIPDADLLVAALSASAERKVQLKWNVRGERAGYVELASRNAQLTLATELNSRNAQHARSDALREMLGLAEPVKRVECFDISHTLGEATVASCVVFDAAGPVRARYRRFNISGIEPGDDYAAMRQAIDRRFRRAVEEQGVLPDVLLIDGGAGQLAQAQAALADLGVEGVLLVGVAKGVERRRA
jgi:excinuclease ABC subunit C